MGEAVTDVVTWCQGPWCRNKTQQPATGRRRDYCSDSCRAAAYRKRRDELCGEPIWFHVAGNPDRSETTCQRKQRDCDGHHQATVTITVAVQASLVP